MNYNHFLLIISLFMLPLPIQGKIIAFSGISGCGKTTMAQLLAKKYDAACITEAEEANWPVTIKDRETYGFPTALLALRQLWAQQFVDAHILDTQEKLVFLDTYFFKLFGLYLDKPGMEWLINPQDPYLSVLKNLNILDRVHFPDAHCVILFEVSIQDWALFLQARGRKWDQDAEFKKSHARTTEYIQEATLEHCAQNNIPVIRFKQKFGDPQLQADLLYELLKQENIID